MVAPNEQMPLPGTQTKQEQISVSLKVPDDLPLTKALAGSLQQVLGALKASDPRGRGWAVVIQDSGILTANQMKHFSIEVNKYNGDG